MTTMTTKIVKCDVCGKPVRVEQPIQKAKVGVVRCTPCRIKRIFSE